MAKLSWTYVGKTSAGEIKLECLGDQAHYTLIVPTHGSMSQIIMSLSGHFDNAGNAIEYCQKLENFLESDLTGDSSGDTVEE